MKTTLRVIALGQSVAGDDGVGLAVLDELRRRDMPAQVELRAVHDASELMPLVQTPVPVVLVDAALGDPPGQVLTLTEHALAEPLVRPVSSHGIDVAGALALARVLAPSKVSPWIRIVVVTIARPASLSAALSPPVAAAVARAADAVLDLASAAEEG